MAQEVQGIRHLAVSADGMDKLRRIVDALATPAYSPTIEDALNWALRRVEVPTEACDVGTVLGWWMQLVQPYVPMPAPKHTRKLSGFINGALEGGLDPRLIHRAFVKLPRLRGPTHSRGFSIYDLFQPREGEPLRIERLMKGRWDAWKMIDVGRQPDISRVLAGEAVLKDWLQLPEHDAEGVYNEYWRHNHRYCTLMAEHAPHDVRFVRDFVRPGKAADVWFETAMRHMLDPIKIDPDRYL